MRTLNALKKLAVKLGCASNVSSVTGNTVDEVINFIESHYKLPAVPTSAGDYKLVVASDGSATWVAI